ncbi:CDP-glycerol glycerophosphotransferase family protein [Alicyclobacillus kakegawensis]|uniref:CDP-glycerol glycerophosphotransferase family protein n=1 Tax=Alicyclobacillus kakegawensis TaxID=392012 RepID=UPI0008362DA3|nr:CDP-glycerol glycerophosphotransferase family protein [Alicyclobacillus kakegawensis]
MKYKLTSNLLAKLCVQAAFLVTSWICSVDPNKVTFASIRSANPEGNLLYLYRELKTRQWQGKCVLLFRKYRGSALDKLSMLFYMIRAGHHLATSRYFVIDDYYFPVYVIRARKGTEIVQLWHAAGAFKKFGYSTVGKSFGPSQEYLKHVRIHSNYDKVFVSAAEVVPHYADAFQMPEERILPLGLPRTDIFFDKDKHAEICVRFYQSFPKLKGRKLILYAPTFRGRSYQQKRFECPINARFMREILGRDYAFIVHLHPFMKTLDWKPGQYDEEFVCCVSDQFSIEELMIVSDILVTDYSSVIFDYSLLGRPMAFFATDLEEYMSERGFYYDYTSFIPGPMFTETEPLANWIKQGDFDATVIERFRDRFFDHRDGKASKRIADYLLEHW